MTVDRSLVEKEPLVPFDKKLLRKLRDPSLIPFLPVWDKAFEKALKQQEHANIMMFFPCAQTKPYQDSHIYKRYSSIIDISGHFGIPTFVQTAMTVYPVWATRYFPYAHYDVSGTPSDKNRRVLENAGICADVMRMEHTRKLFLKMRPHDVIVLGRPSHVEMWAMHHELKEEFGHKLYEVPSKETIDKLFDAKNYMSMTQALLTVGETHMELDKLIADLHCRKQVRETRTLDLEEYQAMCKILAKRRSHG